MLSSKQKIVNLGDRITTRSTKSAYMTSKNDQNVDNTFYKMTRRKYSGILISLSVTMLYEQHQMGPNRN